MSPSVPLSCNHVIEDQLNERAKDLEGIVGGHVLALKGPMMPGIDDYVRDFAEKRTGAKKLRKLMVILETDGGLIEPVRRIADTLHHHYRIVEYLVPNYAMSAGTVLVMSGDAIYMDHYSVLGPIDPQIKSPSGHWVPGLGYVEKFNELMTKANAPPGLNTAEMAYLISKFDPAFISMIQKERALSVALLTEWLVKYKFRNWKKTEAHRRKVTKKMKEDRAKEIANKLNDTNLWYSHGRGIPMRTVRHALNLKIQNFSEDIELNASMRTYYRLLVDYMGRRGHFAALHQNGTPYMGFEGLS